MYYAVHIYKYLQNRGSRPGEIQQIHIIQSTPPMEDLLQRQQPGSDDDVLFHGVELQHIEQELGKEIHVHSILKVFVSFYISNFF